MTVKDFLKKMFDGSDDKNKAQIAYVMSHFVNSKDVNIVITNDSSLANFIDAQCSMNDGKIGFYNDDDEFVAVFICEPNQYGSRTVLTSAEKLKEFLDTVECKKIVTEFSFALLKKHQEVIDCEK